MDHTEKINNLDQHIQRILERTRAIINQCGPRPAGSAASHQSAGLLRDGLAPHCHEAHLEPFFCEPRAFLGYLKISASLSILASLFLFFDHIYIAIAGYFLSHIINILEFGYYREFIDFLFQRKECFNVVATLEPKQAAQRQIIVSAHHDSAYEFRYLSSAPRLYIVMIVLSTLAQWGVPVTLLAALGVQWFAGVWILPELVLKAMAILSIILDVPFLFFLKKNATPGAGDNLVAASLLVELAEIVKTHQGLNRTRLILASFDAEEAGVRGSRAFAKKHSQEFKNLPTYGLNLDSLFDARALEYLTTDINDHVKLSRRLAKDCLEITKRLGYKGRLLHMQYGYGATDAAELAKAGVKATSLVALNTNPADGKVNYHTLRDTVDNLDPKAVRAALEIAYMFVLRHDHDSHNHSA